MLWLVLVMRMILFFVVLLLCWFCCIGDDGWYCFCLLFWMDLLDVFILLLVNVVFNVFVVVGWVLLVGVFCMVLCVSWLMVGVYLFCML